MCLLLQKKLQKKETSVSELEDVGREHGGFYHVSIFDPLMSNELNPEQSN